MIRSDNNPIGDYCLPAVGAWDCPSLPMSRQLRRGRGRWPRSMCSRLTNAVVRHYNRPFSLPVAECGSHRNLHDAIPVARLPDLKRDTDRLLNH
jgi:hypothetical protein